MKIVIYSYYQSKQQKVPKLKGEALACVQKTVDENGALIASDTNLQELDRVRRLSNLYYSDVTDYLTALYCDMEVAIQERKFAAMAELLGCECYFPKWTDKPSFIYTPDISLPSIDNLPLLSDRIEGDVYVINTHGKSGSLDGPYETIFSDISSDNPPQRVVIDACFSAEKYSLKRTSRSAMEIIVDYVLDHGIKLPDSTEFVGFTIGLSVTEGKASSHTATAVFAEKDKLSKDLKLITPKERLTVRRQEEQSAVAMNTNSKLVFFSNKASREKAEEDLGIRILKEAFISACSKAYGLFVTPRCTSQDKDFEIIDFLMGLSFTKAKNLEELARIVTLPKDRSKQLKGLCNRTKEGRKIYILALDKRQLISVVNTGMELLKKYDGGKDYQSSLQAVQQALTSMDSLNQTQVPTL